MYEPEFKPNLVITVDVSPPLADTSREVSSVKLKIINVFIESHNP